MTWHKKLPLPGSTAARIRASRVRRTTGERLRPTLRERKPEQAFYKAYSTVLALNGYRVKVTTRYQIAKLFNVAVATISKWEKAGVLPEPLMYNTRGNTQYPLFLSAQIRCLILVVNDLIRDGSYVSIPWAHLPDHLAMLHEGYGVALNAFHKRAGYLDDPDDDEDMGDKFGVTLL